MTSVNVFEGSRRISLLLKVVWLVGAAVVAWTTSPSVSLRFVTQWPTEMFQQGAVYCVAGTDHMNFITSDIGGSKSAYIQLCFKARRADSGQDIVPYKIDSTGTGWGNERYSSEVTAYADGRANAFALTEVDRQAARDEWTREWWKNVRNGTLFGIGGWIVFSLVQLVIGWIIRGFLGIPWGKDRRPEVPLQTEVS